MKKKLWAVLAAAILLTSGAAAQEDDPQAYREIIEQVAVPLAAANDTGAVINIMYSPEELAELIRSMQEKGIAPEENNVLMQAVQNGHGYFEDETMMEICRLAFGGYHYTWTLEDQDWFAHQMAKAGFSETAEIRMPGKENLTCREAEDFAFRKIREEYGQDLQLENRKAWELERQFTAPDPEEGSDASWYFELIPTDVNRSTFYVTFKDGDPEGTVSVEADDPDWTQPYPAERLMDRFEEVYKSFRGGWTQEVWQRLHEMMQGAEADPESRDYPEYIGYRMTSYPEPTEGEVSREEAIRAAKEALKKDRAALNSAVLAEYEGNRTWLVSLGIHEWFDGKKDPEAGAWVVAVDSITGKPESIREMGTDGEFFMAYVHPAAYEKSMEGRMKEDDYIRIAAEEIRKSYPETDPLDPAEYETGSRWLPGNAREVSFLTKNLRHGDASATVSADGTAGEAAADLSEPTGDTLFGRYRKVYGYFGEWDQETWVRLGKDIQALEPEEDEGRILKSSAYPEENNVRIQHAEAQSLAVRATGAHRAEVNTCVLVSAEPHPVWIMRVLVYDEDGGDPVIGIDAETGETLFTERYYVDETPNYVLFSMPETRGVYRSAFYLARNAVVFTYAGQDLNDPDVNVDNEKDWERERDGLTVRFTGRWKGMKAYEVELDEQGNVLRCEQAESPSTEEKRQAATEEETYGEPVPTPQPDGKPWIWRNPFAPEEYWDRLAAAMEANGVTFENLGAKMVEWSRKYGWNGDSDWPQDLYIIGEILFYMKPSYLDANQVEYPVFPDPEKKPKEEIEEIALKAFREAAGPVAGTGWADRLKMTGVLWNTGIYEFYGLDYPEPAWRISFMELEECWEEKGFVMLDEDGNILTVQVEPYGGG